MIASSDKNLVLYRLFLSALSNHTRLRILDLLRTGPRNVTQIADELGYEQSRVSHNLRCLLVCGFVEVDPVGKERIYSLNARTILPLLDIMDSHVSEFGDRLKGCETLSEAKMVNIRS